MNTEFKVIINCLDEEIDKYDIFNALKEIPYISMLKVDLLASFSDDEMKGFRK